MVAMRWIEVAGLQARGQGAPAARSDQPRRSSGCRSRRYACTCRQPHPLRRGSLLLVAGHALVIAWARASALAGSLGSSRNVARSASC